MAPRDVLFIHVIRHRQAVLHNAASSKLEAKEIAVNNALDGRFICGVCKSSPFCARQPLEHGAENLAVAEPAVIGIRRQARFCEMSGVVNVVTRIAMIRSVNKKPPGLIARVVGIF